MLTFVLCFVGIQLPPQAPPLDEVETYATATARAIATGTPMVVYVGVEPRPIEGRIVCGVEALRGYVRGDVVECEPLDGELVFTRYIRRGAQPLAVPFAEPDDNGPWLSREETEAILKKMPKVNGNPRFYRLRPLYQQLYTMNGGQSRFNVPTPLDADAPRDLIVSGGMRGVHNFTSVKGLDIPQGKRIAVWRENTDVRAFSLVPRWRWAFPYGTVAYDVLFNGNDVFEVRTQTRNETDWETKVIFRDREKFPAGYAGLSQSCASCHNRTGEVVSVPGRIYRHVTWGDDGRFSWRPFKEDGSIDRRWPVEVQ